MVLLVFYKIIGSTSLFLLLVPTLLLPINNYVELARVNFILLFPPINKPNGLKQVIITKYKLLCLWKCETFCFKRRLRITGSYLLCYGNRALDLYGLSNVNVLPFLLLHFPITLSYHTICLSTLLT